MQKILQTPSTIIISALLLLLIATGVANAAALITSADVKDNSLKSKDIKNGTLQPADVKDNSLKATDLAPNSVGSSEITGNSIVTGDVKDGTISSSDIKNGGVASGDLASNSVTADKIAPGAVAFPNALWGTVLRNQRGAAQSHVQAGPGGQPLGDGSLRLFVSGTDDLAAFGNSFDFAGFQLADITNLSYATYNADNPPLVRPSLRMEIDPHLVSDTVAGGLTEFTTLTHEPVAGATGWVTHGTALSDEAWYLTGDEGDLIGCNRATMCTYTELVSALETSPDLDEAAPAISTGVYFGLGSGVSAPTETAVDAFVFNGFQLDFEPMGVFLSPVTP